MKAREQLKIAKETSSFLKDVRKGIFNQLKIFSKGINTQDEEDLILLHHAVNHTNEKAVQLARLFSQVDVNAKNLKNYTALHIAAEKTCFDNRITIEGWC